MTRTRGTTDTQLDRDDDQDTKAFCMTCHLQHQPQAEVVGSPDFLTGIIDLPHLSVLKTNLAAISDVTACTTASYAGFDHLPPRLKDLVHNKKITLAVTRAVARCEDLQFIPVLGPSKQVHELWERQLGYNVAYLTLLRDVVMSKRLTDLHRRYPREYNSYRSRKQWARTTHTEFHPAFGDFREWLIHLGPQPETHWTVDNIAGTKSKGYRPGNVRWASKRTQRANQRRVRGRVSLPDGRRLTTSELAKLVNLSQNTVSKRLSRGWSVERILLESPTYAETWTFPQELMVFEPIYRKRRNKQVSRLEWVIGYLEKLMVSPKFWTYQDPSRMTALASLLEQLQATRNALGIEEERREAMAACALLDGAEAYLAHVDVEAG
ncbi:hypothetical protein LK996_06105 [Lysobacter sp. A6]|uniref:Uncharacterized protein n=1 Tax=Noviluteimonas lactosilytica TaxID=2888523 RepID=A0ABS8JGA8_9GAMM|nr:hypothetical protein [Lysobacter lactosilyticus]MCC8362645.1 hypothetical protein [Lysobacter lactosilyticus]